MRSITLIIFCTFGIAYVSFAQNIRTYTPSVLLRHKQIEATLFNNIYYENDRNDSFGNHINLKDNGEASNVFMTNTLRVNYGFSKQGFVNAGIEVNFNASLSSPDNVHAFSLFTKAPDNAEKRSAVTSIGPKIKYAPFRFLSGFSMQTSALFALSDKNEDSPFLAFNGTTLLQSFYFDRNLGDLFQVFLELTMSYTTESKGRPQFLRIPVSAFFSYFPTQNLTLYVQSQFNPLYRSESNESNSVSGLNQYYLQLGIGSKYQISKPINLELSYTNFVTSRNSRLGTTLDLGIRYLL